MNYQLESPPTGPKPQHRKPVRLPLWLIFLIWGTGAFIGVVYLSQLKDANGQEVLDDKLISVLVPLMALIGALLTQILQKQSAIDHENHPNSGSTHRDATNRIERTVQEALQLARAAKEYSLRAEKAAEEAKKDSAETRDDVQQMRVDLSNSTQTIVTLLLKGNTTHA